MPTEANAGSFTSPRITISNSDYARLVALTEAADPSPVTDYLSAELTRAEIVGDDQLPAGVVRMGSSVTYRDLASGRTRVITLVYPQQADLDRNRVSVLTPVGAALIGLAPGNSMDWPAPAGGSGALAVIAVDDDGEVLP